MLVRARDAGVDLMIEVTKAEFLELYESGDLFEVIGPVDVGTEKRLIGRTPRGAAEEPKRYFVVYVVV